MLLFSCHYLQNRVCYNDDVITTYYNVRRFLPVIRQGDDETAQQFADRTQQVVGRALNLTCIQLDHSDVQKWMGSCELTITICSVGHLNCSQWSSFTSDSS